MNRIELNRLKFALMANDTEENRAKYEAALAEFNGANEEQQDGKAEKEKKSGEEKEKAKKKPN